MREVPPPAAGERPIGELIRALDAIVGRARFAEVCIDLLAGADRASYVVELQYLSGHSRERVLDRGTWKDYWLRTWGARGLLHCWDDAASSQVVRCLADQHYRPAEMCLKVVAAHDVAGAGPGAAALTRSDRPRVRAQAARALGVVGDTDQVAAVTALLDDPDEAVRTSASRAYELLVRRLDLPPDGPNGPGGPGEPGG